MLAQRVATALVLLGLLLPALLADRPWPFQALTLILIAATGWEWGKLNGASARLSLAFGALVALACAGALVLGVGAPPMFWWIVTALWVLGGSWALRAGPQGWGMRARGLRWLVGLLLLSAAWLAIAQARVIGVNFLLSVFALVWAADISAYFSGRAFGRRKLAPLISPGKSWEGVIGGIVGVGLLAVGWWFADAAWQPASASLYTQLVTQVGVIGAAFGLAALTGLSVLGDLFESLVKRAAGAKDSSRLLPGHGGVLDRLDALLPVCPAALALLTL